MSATRVSLLALCLATLTGCGAPITGDWTGHAELEGLADGPGLGLSVTKDAKFSVSGEVVDATAPDSRHAVSGSRIGSVVTLAWQVRDGTAVEVTRLLGQTDGETIDGVLVCERQVDGGSPTYCPSLPAGTIHLKRGTLPVDDPAETTEAAETSDDTGDPAVEG